MKQELYTRGVELMKEFCGANKLSAPIVTPHAKEEWKFKGTCAYYRPTYISICVDQCANIGRAGRLWSYPGYVVDRTPYGVVQHELGHHVDFTLSDARTSYGGDFSTKLRAATGELRITSYCPNDMEWFAEIFRLFVTNSDLLKTIRPVTYASLKEIYRPVVDAPWRKILADAPERTLIAAARK